MKILQICAYSAPYSGNFMKSLFALEKEAKKDGYTTIYCFPEKNKNIDWCVELEKTNQVYYLPLRNARILPQTYWRLHKIFKAHPDICYAHSHFELYDNPLVLMAPKYVKIFWHLHDAIGNYLHGVYKCVWKLHYSLFSHRPYLLSVSEKHKKVVIDLGFNESRAFYIPNAIDTQRVKVVDNDRTSKYDFLIFGWDYFRKGVDLAIASVKDSNLELKLGIVGGAVDEINEVGGACVRNVNPSSDINEIFSMTKCFLHISRAEGLSYALLEALYSGLPVIVSDIEENLIAQEFPTAIMVKSEDVTDITNAIKRLSETNFKVPLSDVQETRKLIEEKYSIDLWAKRIFNTYKTLE